MKPNTSAQTVLAEFSANQPFQFGQHNAAETTKQSADGGGRYYTSSKQFLSQVVTANPTVFRIHSTAKRLKVTPREKWPSANFAKRKVLFLLPSHMLGSNVATLLFMHAFSEQKKARRVGVFCAGSAADIYLTSDLAEVYTLWISRSDLKRWDVVIDLGQLESRRDVDVWPVDMESELLQAFGLDPSGRFPGEARDAAWSAPPHIGILPLASSPLRTLPPRTTLELAKALAEFGQVTLCLNRFQHQGRLYQTELAGKLPAGVEIIDAFDTIGGLVDAVRKFDYAVYADSGPAHIAKLFAAPGTAVYTAAHGDILQGRFTNLARWSVDFSGPHCTAPCGLAKLRLDTQGRMGCMGSLQTELENLPSTPKSAANQDVERLLLNEPVPCVAALGEQTGRLVEFVVEDFKRRQRMR